MIKIWGVPLKFQTVDENWFSNSAQNDTGTGTDSGEFTGWMGDYYYGGDSVRPNRPGSRSGDTGKVQFSSAHPQWKWTVDDVS